MTSDEHSYRSETEGLDIPSIRDSSDSGDSGVSAEMPISAELIRYDEDIIAENLASVGADLSAQAEPPFAISAIAEPPPAVNVPRADVFPPTPPEFQEPPEPPEKSRLEELTDAIKAFPNSPTNYILRAEVLYALRDYEASAQDFYTGWKLAREAAQTADWGYIYEALIERAEAGLHRLS